MTALGSSAQIRQLYLRKKRLALKATCKMKRIPNCTAAPLTTPTTDHSNKYTTCQVRGQQNGGDACGETFPLSLIHCRPRQRRIEIFGRGLIRR